MQPLPPLPSPSEVSVDYERVARRGRLGKALACALLAAIIGWLAFVSHVPVPLLDRVDLGFHELGHLLFQPAPEVLDAMMGNGLQTATPLILALYFLVRRDAAAAGLMLAWCGETLAYAATYIEDAKAQALPLLYPGTYHDWAFVLGPAHFDALDEAQAIGGWVHLAGVLLTLAGLTLCLLQAMTQLVRLWSLRRSGPAGRL